MLNITTGNLPGLVGNLCETGRLLLLSKLSKLIDGTHITRGNDKLKV